MVAMTNPIQPHPKNVAGPFYVEYGCCTACDLPKQEAPNHFVFDDGNHCYVCRQPQTTAETTTMIGTAWLAELQCIRYRGSDQDVLRRLAELDLRDICDVEPPTHIEPVIRNHVQFAAAGKPTITKSEQLAHEFIKHLMTQENGSCHIKVTPIQSSINSSSFEFSWFEDRFHPILFAGVPGLPFEWHVEFPLVEDLGARGVGNIVWRWLKSDTHRFTNIRWYTDSCWHGNRSWQATPW